MKGFIDAMKDKRLVEYCTGCGLCEAENIATLNENSKGFSYPQSGDEEKLKRLCPATGGFEKYMDSSEIWGKNKAVYLGWSNHGEIRSKASSGGVLTELACFLIENNRVDAIIHIGASECNPTKTQVYFSRSRKEIISRCGSRYSVSHPLSKLAEIDKSLKYCFIGRPCDVVALRKYMEIKPELKSIIPYTFSFFCMGIPSAQAQEALLKALNCSTENCRELTYRGNGWPGFTTAVDTEGVEHRMDYDSSWGKILGRDLMPACRFCIDGVGELADISCADAWYLDNDGKPDFSEHEGRNAVFARTDKGAELINEAKASSYITVTEYDGFCQELKLIQKSQYERRAAMRARLAALKLTRRPYPACCAKLLKSYSAQLPKKKQLKIFLGTCKRIVKGKL